jgi:hypothetical protein
MQLPAAIKIDYLTLLLFLAKGRFCLAFPRRK